MYLNLEELRLSPCEQDLPAEDASAAGTARAPPYAGAPQAEQLAVVLYGSALHYCLRWTFKIPCLYFQGIRLHFQERFCRLNATFDSILKVKVCSKEEFPI